MEKNARILLKLTAAVVFTLLFIWLIYKDKTDFQLKQPEGEMAQAEEVLILVRELEVAGVQMADQEGYEKALAQMESQAAEKEQQYISYEMYCMILKAMLGDVQTQVNVNGQQQKTLEKLYNEILYEKKYKEEFDLLKEDWYSSYDKLLAYYGLTDVIKEEKLEILCGASGMAGEKQLQEEKLLTAGGKEYICLSEQMKDLEYTVIRAYVREDRLLTLTETLKDTFTLSNVWVMESNAAGIQFFYQDYELLADWQQAPEFSKKLREQIGDISFSQGKIKKLDAKTEKISGKLLRLGEGDVEVDGYGTVALQEKCKGYRLYEELQEVDTDALSIGYDFAEFVIEDGEVCAFLILRKEKMESIRVLIKSNDFGSLYQQEIQLRCQEDLLLTYGDYEDRKQEQLSAGEVLTLKSNSAYLKGERLEIEPVVKSGKIEVLSLQRSQGTPAYRGKLEVSLQEQGLVLINEVLLEEYLYSVVPSEMPASYPVEALKAQAICARTYAYRYLQSPGLGNLGAHVDDSTGYQVYNNIAENVNSTKAVKETSGELLLYEGEPVDTYYYSTSCGYGADQRVWQEDPENGLAYLQPVYIAKENQENEEEGENNNRFSPEELADEENFREYILSTDQAAYEKEEVWYRWKCEVKEIDTALLSKRLTERYGVVPDKILTFTGKGEPEEEGVEFTSQKPKVFEKIYEIICTKRLPGGVMNELLIKTDQGTYKVISEYNIRYLLNQDCEIIRQDGSAYQSSQLLPSAYMIIDTVKSGKNVVGYTLNGGGYGHGAGMSQNGAKAMAVAGKDAEFILSFFFTDCVIESRY